MRKIKMAKQLFIWVNIEIFKLIIYFLILFSLFKASFRGHLEIVSLLINNERCNINEKDVDGHAAFHLG